MTLKPELPVQAPFHPSQLLLFSGGFVSGMGFAVDPGFAPIAASILLVVALVAVMAFLRGTRDDSARQFSKNSVSGFTGLVLGFILVMIFRLANAA